MIRMENDVVKISQKSELSIEYSIESEISRIKNTIERISWYKKNGYSLERLSFPKSLDKDMIFSSEAIFTDDNIREAVISEFNNDSYKKVADSLKNKWGDLIDEFEVNLKKSNLQIQPKYRIVLTEYGMGGSYNMPDFVFLNIKSKEGDVQRIFITLIHEIIHLSIEDLIQKNKLSQWQKERIVDLTLSAFFPDNKRMQKNPLPEKELARIDAIFIENFPNIHETIKKVGCV